MWDAYDRPLSSVAPRFLALCGEITVLSMTRSWQGCLLARMNSSVVISKFRFRWWAFIHAQIPFHVITSLSDLVWRQSTFYPSTDPGGTQSWFGDEADPFHGIWLVLFWTCNVYFIGSKKEDSQCSMLLIDLVECRTDERLAVLAVLSSYFIQWDYCKLSWHFPNKVQTNLLNMDKDDAGNNSMFYKSHFYISAFMIWVLNATAFLK